MTGGTSVGVMKSVGKAVRDYYIQKPENNNIVALGIAALDYIANGSDFDEAKVRSSLSHLLVHTETYSHGSPSP